MAVIKKISELTAKGSNIGANDLVIVGVSNGTDYDLKSVTGNQLVSAAVAQTITNGVTTTAPSQDAVFDALALKVDTVVGSRLITSAEGTILGNTSGVNSGDETVTTIKTKLGITTLSGSNTGDQDLSGYQPLLSGGTTNRLTKWSSSSAITSSLIQDNGTTLSIGTTPVANNLVKISSNATDTTLVSENSQASGVGISGSSSGSNGVGGSFTSTSVTGVKIGVNASATGAGGTNKGAVFGATGGATNYSIQLTDGTQGSGKFLKSVTANGEANWSSIANTDVSGLGTLATQSGTFSGTSSGTNTGDQVISDATITTTDITTNNFTTAKHGFVPKGTNTGKFLKDDGTWGTPASGGLTYFSEAQSTASPNATVNVDSLTAVASTTNADFAILPKGTGAFIVGHIPDGTGTGGNKRGVSSIEIQLGALDSSGAIASGANSILIGSKNYATGASTIAIGNGAIAVGTNAIAIGTGNNIRADGANSLSIGQNGNFSSSTGQNSIALCGGQSSGIGSFAVGYSIASGTNSVAMGGVAYDNATASGYASFAVGQANLANGANSIALGYSASTKGIASRLSLASYTSFGSYVVGNSQSSLSSSVANTTTNTAVELTTTGGTAICLTLQNNEAIRVKGSIIGKQTASTNVACYDFDCVIVRGTTAASTILPLSNVNLVLDTITLDTIPTLTANTTLGGLSVKSGAKTTTTIKWSCRIDSTEVILA